MRVHPTHDSIQMLMYQTFPSYLFSHFVIHEVYELHCELGNAMSVQLLPWSVSFREGCLQKSRYRLQFLVGGFYL